MRVVAQEKRVTVLVQEIEVLGAPLEPAAQGLRLTDAQLKVARALHNPEKMLLAVERKIRISRSIAPRSGGYAYVAIDNAGAAGGGDSVCGL